jgi:hypothetical protein
VAGPQELLADDHPIVVEGMQALLKDQCELVGTSVLLPLISGAIIQEPKSANQSYSSR